VKDELRTLLADLARYLEQQRQAGSSFYLEGEAALDAPSTVAAAGPVEASPPEGPPQDTPVAEPAPTPPPAAPAPPRPEAAPSPADAARSEREEAFRRECEAFVRDTLALIARTRAHGARPERPGPEQADIFGAAPDPVAPPPPEPEVPADRAAALAAIGEEARACTACPLHAGRQNAVPGSGNAEAGLVLVGEAPGAEEDRQGLPFVGRSGQLLTDILKAIGFARDEVFICNILKCRPPGNRDPERPEVEACEPFLRRQLAVIRPRLILCLGRVAAQTLLGTTAPLGSLRRSVHFFAGVPVMATFHPAALLRNPGHKRDTWDDVRRLRALYDALGPVD
jgi:DNA polymerase